ncbi:unnamed protein product [Mytilus coruscus]|uniref:Uncharacterized protein n=1 Tax=Mytilus coruscus TaxID=42192 RepID=A0A6J8B9J0_MYTCO|nr:unnamed protein product [Mytilus coruscus]
MDNWIFRKLYDDSGNEDKVHIVRNNGRVSQVCLHKYITRNIAIHELDISAISFLLRNLGLLSQNETTALDTVATARSKICHAHSMKCYSIIELNTVWNELENALVDLADPFYKRIIRNQIKGLQKVYLEKEEITDLLKRVAEVNVGIIEVKNCMSSNNNAIEKCEGNLKTMIAEESLEMKQAQQVVLKEVISSKAIVKERGDNMSEQLGILNTNQTEMSGKIKELVEMVHQIHSTTISVKYEQSTDLSEGEECLVLWQLATPANWNPIEIEQILTKFQERFKDLPMKIKFVRNGSLVIMTTITAKDLKDSKTFQSAVKVFLTRMVEVCNIDTTVTSNVDVTLHILKSDEMKFTYGLPNIATDDKVVQTEDAEYTIQMGLKKRMKELEKLDVAFFISDNEKEMKWVQIASRILEEKFDIKCAILGEEFMYAVIITLTKENYGEYDFYTEDDTPFIAVELEYINEVRTNLRKYQYINFTVCEHLWFPRLNDILKTNLPEHLRKKIESNKDEIDKECEKCKHSVTTAVHHRVEIRKKSLILRFILCASLADEGWILNLLYQMLYFTKPYMITSWKKSIETPFPFSTIKVFFLVSPNLRKCKSLEKYAYSVLRQKGITIHSLKIANIEGLTFTRLVHSSIDATNMNQKELAHKTFSSAESKFTLNATIDFHCTQIYLHEIIQNSTNSIFT